MKVNYKYIQAIIDGDKLPRKHKKLILGKKLSRTKLDKMINFIKLGAPIKTMWDRREILPFDFCPYCGCTNYYGSGNLAAYPEHLEAFRCFRCKNVVALIDNSPFVHILEYGKDWREF